MRTIQLLIILCCTTWLASCSSDDEYTDNNTDERIAVNFSAGMGNVAVPDASNAEDSPTLRTSADGTQWQAGDNIGIFMIGNGAIGISGNIKENADNIEYKADNGTATSSFSPVSGTPIYYPQDGDKVDFIAYYPYKATLNNYTYPVDVSDQTNPAALDVLYSDNAKDIIKSPNATNLNFKHKLCGIVFNFISSGSITQQNLQQLTADNVTFQNFPTKTTINLETGEVARGTDRNLFNPIKSEFPPTGVDAQFRAVLVPDMMKSGRKLTIRFTSRVYNLDLSSYDFKSGEEWTIKVLFTSARNHAAESDDTGTGELVIKSCHKEVWR